MKYQEKIFLQNSYVRKQYEDVQRSLVLGTQGTDQVEYLIYLVFIKKQCIFPELAFPQWGRGGRQ